MEREITKGWPKKRQFSKAVEALPLISIDLRVNNQIGGDENRMNKDARVPKNK